MTRKEKISRVQKNIDLAKQFLQKYDELLPEDFGNISVEHEMHITFHCSNDLREQQLELLGRVFGRNGWTAELEYYGKFFNWSKELDGVKLIIYCAQNSTTPEKFPVDPKQFPIQLEDVKG